MSDWWYEEKQKKSGPVSEADLCRLLQSGKIDLSTMAWQEGMEAWRPLGEIETLNSLQLSIPPPLPIKKDIDPGSLPLATRWPRFFARTFDLWWETLLIAYSAGFTLGHYSAWYVGWINKPGATMWFGILCVPAALALDAVLYAVAGNTPGKVLLGLKVTNLDGTPLSFGQYIKRNLGCWVSGYAFGLPLFNLFTMSKQSSLVHKGLPASYDEGPGYRVHSRPFSAWKVMLFTVLFVCILGVMGQINNTENSVKKKTLNTKQENYSWENPSTQISCLIDANWKHSTQTNDEAQQVYMFTEATDHAVVIFATEKPNGNFALDDYVRAFRKSTKANMSFSDGGRFFQKEGHPVWQCSGIMTTIKNSNRLNVQIVQHESSFWRIVTIQTMPYDYSDAMVQALQTILWSTVR